jgi:glycosyltransferase involved in cell wall biosynthesis
MITGGKYVAKIPGDIVWERAINSKYSNLEVRDFQNTKLNLKYGFFRYLFSKSILRAETVVVPSPLLFELCLLWGVPENKIHLIFNSIDVEYFIPNGFSNREYDCIVVNRLVAWKNVPEIIRACHSLNLTLLIVGDGPEMHTLRALADDLNSKVLFMGNSAHDELLRYLQSAKFYILNSTADATAYSLLEARSCGLIAIANMETGASEVIDHGKDGFLTKTTDQSELESVLTALLQREPSELEEMSLRARKSTVQKFNKNDNFSQILELTVNSNAR